jgi:transcription-repair coupling factor (superfamily II helicase)
VLTAQAERRLKVLQSLDRLGAGFELASHDLDIRGAGNLLGDEQSGHIKEVGYELYQQMLEEAVAQLKAGVTEEDLSQGAWSPTIAIGAPVMIPEAYVPDLTLRMQLYKRLSGLETDTDIEAFGIELADRFGPLPHEVRQLLAIVGIKALCLATNVEKVEAGPRGIIISFRDNRFARPEELIRYVTAQGSLAKVRPDMRIVFTGDFESEEQRMKGVASLLRDLVALIEKPALTKKK